MALGRHRDRGNSQETHMAIQNISVEVSPGELIDKITILEIKSERMTDSDKLKNVRTELATLIACRDLAIVQSPELIDLSVQLKQVNESLWKIEDDIRDCERQRDFGSQFVELARSVYKSNDRRAALKRQINDLLGSRIIEEKSYAEY
jgi:hypothetical protein